MKRMQQAKRQGALALAVMLGTSSVAPAYAGEGTIDIEVSDEVSQEKDVATKEEVSHDKLDTDNQVNDELVDDEIVDEEVSDDELADDELVDDEVSDDELVDDELVDEEVSDDELVDDELADEEVSDDELADDEIVDEEVSDDELADDEIMDEEVSDDELAEDSEALASLLPEEAPNTFNASAIEANAVIIPTLEANATYTITGTIDDSAFDDYYNTTATITTDENGKATIKFTTSYKGTGFLNGTPTYLRGWTLYADATRTGTSLNTALNYENLNASALSTGFVSFDLSTEAGNEHTNYYATAAIQNVDGGNSKDIIYTLDWSSLKQTIITTSLSSAISDANKNLESVKTSTDGGDVETDEQWVTQDVYNAYSEAITAAQEALTADNFETQAAVTAVVDALATKTDTFNSAKATGTLDLTSLTEAIEAAEENLTSVSISADGTDIDVTLQWVTQAIYTAYETAINDAQTALDSADSNEKATTAKTALDSATSTFNGAKAVGTNADAVGLFGNSKTPLGVGMYEVTVAMMHATKEDTDSSMNKAVDTDEPILLRISQDEVTEEVTATIEFSVNPVTMGAFGDFYTKYYSYYEAGTDSTKHDALVLEYDNRSEDPDAVRRVAFKITDSSIDDLFMEMGYDLFGKASTHDVRLEVHYDTATAFEGEDSWKDTIESHVWPEPAPTFSFGSAEVELEAGSYDIEIAMMQSANITATSNSISQAVDTESPITLNVDENGESSITFSLLPLNGIYTKNYQYYTNFAIEDNVASGEDANRVDATIIEYYDVDGNTNTYPKTVQMAITDNRLDGLLFKMGYDINENLSQNHDVYMAINYAMLADDYVAPEEEVFPDVLPDGNETPPDETPEQGALPNGTHYIPITLMNATEDKESMADGIFNGYREATVVATDGSYEVTIYFGTFMDSGINSLDNTDGRMQNLQKTLKDNGDIESITFTADDTYDAFAVDMNITIMNMKQSARIVLDWTAGNDSDSDDNTQNKGYGSQGIELEAGSYTVPISMVKENDHSEESMADQAIEHTGILKIAEDGKTTITYNFISMDLNGTEGYASNIKYYTTDTEDNKELKAEDLVDATINSYHEADPRAPHSVTMDITHHHLNGLYVMTDVLDLDFHDGTVSYLIIDYAHLILDKTELDSAITNAKLNLSAVKESADGTDVALTQYWATAEQIATYQNAIDDAQLAYDTASSAENITDAVTALANATKTFDEAKKLGTDENAVDTSALSKAIADAKDHISHVTVSINGEDIPTTQTWVTQADVDTYDQAIDTAQAVLDKNSATKEEVDGAVTTLANATKVFEEATKEGLFDTSKLQLAINEAETNLASVLISEDGKDVATTDKWVTDAVSDAYKNAIATATTSMNLATTLTEVNSTISTLANATTVFDESKKDGTYVPIGYGSTAVELKEGSYTIPVSLKNAYEQEKDSMAAAAIGETATLNIDADGNASLDIQFNSVALGEITGYATSVEYFTDKEWASLGNKVGAEVHSYHEVNGDSQYAPKDVTLTITHNDLDGLYLSLFVDAINMAQNAYLTLDYASILEESSPEKPDEPETEQDGYGSSDVLLGEGVYTVDIAMMHATTPDTTSSMNKAVDTESPILLRIDADGNTTIEFSVNPVTMGAFGDFYTKYYSYYEAGTDSKKHDATVLEYDDRSEDPDAVRRVQFVITDHVSDDLFIEMGYDLFGKASTHDVRLAIDYTTASAFDTSELESKIATAEENLASVHISTDGSDAFKNEKWVTQAVYDAYEQAINDAKTALDSATNQTALDEAQKALVSATVTFLQAKQDGTADASALSNAVTNAETNLHATKISTDGKDIKKTETWVTQAVYDDYEQAIATARAVALDSTATAQTRIQAMSDLTTATTTFNLAKKAGINAFEFGSGTSATELVAGTYTIPVALKNAYEHDTPSMAAGAIGETATLTIDADGNASINLDFGPVEFTGLTGYATVLEYFTDKVWSSSGKKVSAEINSYHTVNGDSKYAPKNVTFKITHNELDGLYLSTYVDVEGMGTQSVYMTLDYAQAKRINVVSLGSNDNSVELDYGTKYDVPVGATGTHAEIIDTANKENAKLEISDDGKDVKLKLSLQPLYDAEGNFIKVTGINWKVAESPSARTITSDDGYLEATLINDESSNVTVTEWYYDEDGNEVSPKEVELTVTDTNIDSLELLLTVEDEDGNDTISSVQLDLNYSGATEAAPETAPEDDGTTDPEGNEDGEGDDGSTETPDTDVPSGGGGGSSSGGGGGTTTTTVDITKNGTYSVPIKMMHAYEDQVSMGDTTFNGNRNATVVTKDGTYTVTMGLGLVTVGTLTGGLSSISSLDGRMNITERGYGTDESGETYISKVVFTTDDLYDEFKIAITADLMPVTPSARIVLDWDSAKSGSSNLNVDESGDASALEEVSTVIPTVAYTSGAQVSAAQINELVEKNHGLLIEGDDDIEMIFYKQVLSHIARVIGDYNVRFFSSKIDATALSEEQQEFLGKTPLFEISAIYNNRNLTSLNGNTFTVSVPFEMSEAENENIFVKARRFDTDGTITEYDATYDAEEHIVTFETDTFGIYNVYETYVEGSAEEEFYTWFNEFTDIDMFDWFYHPVIYVLQNKLFYGVSDTEFSPNTAMTREMLVTVLHRYAGTPEVETENKFYDVDVDQYYANAVIWASENGIVAGYSEDMFGVGDSITREQLVTILYRYSNNQGMNTESLADLSAFEDLDSISDYAMIPMQWAVDVNLVYGTSETTLSAQKEATRAEVAAILMRYIENIVS